MTRALSGFLIASALLWSGGGAHAAEVDLRLHHFLPASSFVQTGLLEPWAERIEARSGGRIEIEIVPAMPGDGTAGSLYDQAKEGAADLVWTMASHTPGRFPLLEMFELPFMAASAEATSQALHAFANEHVAGALEGVRPLAFHVHAPGSLHVAARSIATLEELQELEIYAPTTGAAAALAALGASPIEMPVVPMPDALGRDGVAGRLLPFALAGPLGVADLPDHHTLVPGLYTSVFLLVMNQERYEALPEDLKAVIDASSGQALAALAGRLFDRAELAAMQAAGDDDFLILDYLELERWRAGTQPAVNAWIEAIGKRGHDGDTLLGRARALLAHYAGRS